MEWRQRDTQPLVGLTKSQVLRHIARWWRPQMKRELDPPKKSGEYLQN